MALPLLEIHDLPPLPLAEIEAKANGDRAAELQLAACWGYQLAASDLAEVTTPSLSPQ
jgi:hypothetical protein